MFSDLSLLGDSCELYGDSYYRNEKNIYFSVETYTISSSQFKISKVIETFQHVLKPYSQI